LDNKVILTGISVTAVIAVVFVLIFGGFINNEPDSSPNSDDGNDANENDSDTFTGILAEDLCPDVDILPDGWKIHYPNLGASWDAVYRYTGNWETVHYKGPDKGISTLWFSVEICVFNTIEEARAMYHEKDVSLYLTHMDDKYDFDQFAMNLMPIANFIFQIDNVYGIIHEYSGKISTEIWNSVISDIESRVINALEL